jgi:hypothetical protein
MIMCRKKERGQIREVKKQQHKYNGNRQRKAKQRISSYKIE